MLTCGATFGSNLHCSNGKTPVSGA